MCKGYGKIEEVRIYYNPKNRKHLGIGKVLWKHLIILFIMMHESCATSITLYHLHFVWLNAISLNEGMQIDFAAKHEINKGL